MHGEERRDDAEFPKRLDLVLAGGLAVDGRRTPVLPGFLGGRAHALEELVDGGVAVHVRDDVPVVGETRPDLGQDVLVRQGRIAAVVLVLTVGRCEVGIGEPGGAPLR